MFWLSQKLKSFQRVGTKQKYTFLQGRITKEIISRYHVDIMVMSCKGLDINSGALDSNEAEAEIKRQ